MYQQYINNPKSMHDWRINRLDGFLKGKHDNIDIRGTYTMANILLWAREHHIHSYLTIIQVDLFHEHNVRTIHK